MRLKLALIVMLGWPAVAAAQSAAPAPGSVPPLAPMGLPLPQIGLPHPPMGLPAPVAPQSREGADLSGRRGRAPHRPEVYLVPIYMWPYVYVAPAAADPFRSAGHESMARPEPPRTGLVQLDVQPGSSQIYVDGYYVGTADDFRDGLEIEAGRHAIEIRASGYETLDVPLAITPGRSTSYRGTLKAVSPPSVTDAAAVSLASPVAPRTPMTIYVIPGCYIGNVPPQDAGLPPDCDASRVTTITK